MALRNVAWGRFGEAAVSYDYDDADEGVTAVLADNPAGSGRTFTFSLLNPDGTVSLARSWGPGQVSSFNVRSLNRVRLLDKLGHLAPFASARLAWG